MKDPQQYIEVVTQWAASCDTVRALALVGSHVTEQAGPKSDIDFVILCDDKSKLTNDTAWVQQFGKVTSCTREEWGTVTSVRVFYSDRQEIEFGLAPPDWVELTFGDKIPEGASDRIKILLDDSNLLGKLRKGVQDRENI